MKKMRMSDLGNLPECYRIQLKQKLGMMKLKVEPTKTVLPTKVGKKMTKTEMEYERLFLQGKGAKFEGVTLKMSNGHRYTPDFVYWTDSVMTCVEVKGSYRLQSYQRARLAFDQAKVEFPAIRFYWVEKTKDGEWRERK